MTERWIRAADGNEFKAEATAVRGAAAPFSLGMVPIIVDVLVTTAASPVAPDDRIDVSSPVTGAVVGDPVFVCPNTQGPDISPGNELYGLTIGPCVIDFNGVRIYLQNRTAAPIVISGDFRLRVCVLHLLPEPP